LNDSVFLQRLRRLIGRDCRYLGRRCRLVEILAEEGTLVLETRDGEPPIQIDQYGQAAYRAHEFLQIPIFGEGQEALSNELLQLLSTMNKDSGLAGGASE
jgi:hypothetical protein